VKEYGIGELRNVGLVAHGGAGKTSLAEAMLYNAGATNRLGKVDDGTTISDYGQDEVERKISISASLLHLDWRGQKINLIDMPGYADFVGEVIGGLRVCETALIPVSAVAGLEVGTESVWGWAERYGCARAFFVNKIEKEHASFEPVLKALQERFGLKAVPVQVPIGEGLDFKGIVDLIMMKAYQFGGDKPKEMEIPGESKDRFKELKEKLVEVVAESDDALLEKFFEAGSLSEKEIREGLKKGIAKGEIFPVFCGSATGNAGVSLLLDAIVDYFPSPADVKVTEGNTPGSGEAVPLRPEPGSPACAFVFKTISEPHVGELSLFRVYSGKVQTGLDLLNPRSGTSERIGQIYTLNGRERHEIGTVGCGDIAAAVKLKDTHTGDTLADKSRPVVLPPIDFPKPVINLAIRPKAKGDEDKISSGFAKLHDEDPTFSMAVDGELKQTIIHGQGELHLEVIIDRLKRKFGAEVELEKPGIPYRETITASAEVQGKYKRQSGGRGQYGDCWLRLEPLPRGSGFEFVDAIVGGVIPSKFVPAVEKGIVEAMGSGELAGYRVVDLKVTCYDGSHHSVDSSDLAFKIAGSMGFKSGFAKARPVLLEPIYNVEVMVPDDFTGDVVGDLSSRRGRIMGMDPRSGHQVIRAQVPLAELYKYSTSLRSLTQGRGAHTREFSHYEEVPKEIADKIVAETKGAKEAASK
jgi:elongation factor G